MNQIKNPNDICWVTGNFTDECICEICDHRFDCSGYTGDDYEDED